MPALTLKNLPEDLLRDLRQAAEADRRSLNQEAIHLLGAALRSGAGRPTRAAEEAAAQVAAWRRLAGRWQAEVDAATEARGLMQRRSRGRKVAL